MFERVLFIRRSRLVPKKSMGLSPEQRILTVVEIFSSFNLLDIAADVAEHMSFFWYDDVW